MNDRERGSRTRGSCGLWLVVILSLVIGLASLALNGVLIYELWMARRAVNQEVDRAIAALDNVEGTIFEYEYRFEQEIPFSTDVPFQQDLVIPFEGTIPINTTVQVPINAGALGNFVVNVPIDTEVYVNTSVPVQIDQTFPVSTTVPVDLNIPIAIQADDPAVQSLIDGLRGWLARLRELL